MSLGDNKNKDNQGNSGQEQEYFFLNETVKETPVDFKRVIRNIVGLISAAILFGIVAALVFCAVVRLNNASQPEKNGIQPGDIITSVWMGDVATLRSLRESIISRSPGETLEVVVKRRGNMKYTNAVYRIKLGSVPERYSMEKADDESETEDDT